MMPKPTDRLKKIWPTAEIHTLVSFSAAQSGVKKALRPLPAPSRVREMTTSAMKATTSAGMKMTAVRPMPAWTPIASTPIVTTQKRTIVSVISGTKSKVGPGVSAALR